MEEEIKILYVDDEPALLDIARLILEKTGNFIVSTSISAQDALGSSKIPSYDAIIADYQMPGMDGIAFLKEVRHRYGDIPFILFTGRGREEVVIEAINNGATFYLQKGGDPSAQFAELAHKIRQAVSRKRAELSQTKAENALRESEERLQLFIRHAPVALAMFDRDMRYLAASWRWMADYHLGDRDILGHSHYEIFPEITENLKAIHRRALLGEVVSADEEKFERQDGSVQWVSWEVRPWYTEGTVVGGIIIFSEDISRRKKTEDELRKSEERLHLAIDATSDGLFDWDMERDAAYFSPRYFTMLGYEPGGLPAAMTTWTGLLHLDDRDQALAAVREYGEGIRDSHSIEFRLRAKDGSWRWILSRGKITGRNAEGKPVRMVGTHTDITDRKHIEEALRESEEKYRSFVEKANEAITILQDGRHVFANSRMAALVGIPVNDLIGTSFLDTIWPEDREMLRARYVRRCAGETVPETYDFRITGPGGKPHWIYISIAKIQWQGRPATLNLMTDITERKLAETALKESEEKYRHILEYMQDAYIRTDESGIITMVNPSAVRMYGYGSVAEMRGIPAVSLYAGAEHQRGNLLGKLPGGGGITDFSGEALQKDGTIFWVSVNAQNIRDKDGRILGAEAMVRDMTERRAMERAIREANRKLALLNSITRHDITNQLTILEGFTRIAAEKERDPVIAGYLTKIGAGAAMIGRQIAFTKAYQDLGVNTPGWILLRETVATAARQEVRYSGTCNDIEIFSDPMLEKVFFNLFENALRHGGHVTEINVRCERTPDNLLVTVEDNGTGIPADEKEKIFEKGFGKNTGLGLFLAREILAITDITIKESGTPGKGAKFEIVVPKGKFRSIQQKN